MARQALGLSCRLCWVLQYLPHGSAWQPPFQDSSPLVSAWTVYRIWLDRHQTTQCSCRNGWNCCGTSPRVCGSQQCMSTQPYGSASSNCFRRCVVAQLMCFDSLQLPLQRCRSFQRWDWWSGCAWPFAITPYACFADALLQGCPGLLQAFHTKSHFSRIPSQMTAVCGVDVSAHWSSSGWYLSDYAQCIALVRWGLPLGCEYVPQAPKVRSLGDIRVSSAGDLLLVPSISADGGGAVILPPRENIPSVQLYRCSQSCLSSLAETADSPGSVAAYRQFQCGTLADCYELSRRWIFLLVVRFVAQTVQLNSPSRLRASSVPIVRHALKPSPPKLSNWRFIAVDPQWLANSFLHCYDFHWWHGVPTVPFPKDDRWADRRCSFSPGYS